MSLSESFSFNKRDVANYLLRTLNANSKFRESFNYLSNTLELNPVVKDLGELEWNKGKNYDWVALQDDNLTLLIRNYRHSFTIYFKLKDNTKEESLFNDMYYSRYGCFLFETDIDKVKNPDSYYDNKFKDLNKHLKSLINLIKNKRIHCLCNSVSFPRPKHVDVKNVWDGDDSSVESIDLFTYALVELFQKHLDIFSENDMFEHIKTLKNGDMIGYNIVLEVRTKLENDYYHGVGLTIKDHFHNEKYCDVYHLTRYYYDDIFKK